MVSDLQRFNQLSYKQQITYVCGCINSLHHNNKHFHYSRNLNRTIKIMKITYHVNKLFNQITENIPLANLTYKVHEIINTLALIGFLINRCNYQIIKLNRSIRKNNPDYRAHKIMLRSDSLVQSWITTNISNHNNLYLNINGSPTIIKGITLNYKLMRRLKYYLVGMYYGGISCLNNKKLPDRPPIFPNRVPKETLWTLPKVNLNISLKLDKNKELALFNSS